MFLDDNVCSNCFFVQCNIRGKNWILCPYDVVLSHILKVGYFACHLKCKRMLQDAIYTSSFQFIRPFTFYVDPSILMTYSMIPLHP